MPVTKVYNKNLLREHPDLSPVADPSFQKGHSFIFPGDELVMCTTIDAPTDIGGTWVGVTLQSVKMSIIAKKPNIFSEEFDSTFASTRTFELDSFSIPLGTGIAPIVPWGTDGYAPNVNGAIDRNWALPSGDFRREIKGFTEHTPGTQSWLYNFWFPIIFREEYWNALIAADNDFYDNLQPQNGKNQKWLRYHDLAFPPFGWKIFYRFELSYTKFGITSISNEVLMTELNLSNEQIGIQDYESNLDYTLRSIKTCPVGGTPSNVPKAYIFGGQNTSCFGYFTKQTPWDDPAEKADLAATFRIRPFEGGDRLGSRGSSKYPATADVVWTANTQPISTSDANINITTDFGDTIVIDDNGIPVEITFDTMDDKNIIVKAEIDYVKLNLIYPGVNNFTLYCRLYNSRIYKT